jgi:hypothetical protein
MNRDAGVYQLSHVYDKILSVATSHGESEREQFKKGSSTCRNIIKVGFQLKVVYQLKVNLYDLPDWTEV